MPAITNTGVIFKSYPTGYPVPGETIEVVHRQIDPDTVELADGDILLRNLELSLDPYMRGRMRAPENKSYTAGFEIGKVLTGHGVSEVIKSNNPDFKKGDITYGIIGWEQYSHIPAAAVKLRGFRVLKHARTSGLPLSNWIGVLGMPGITAWVGLERIGQPKAGETLLVSAAAGAVGQLVGQLAKAKGLRVVGSCGDDAKVEYLLKELKFDAAFNYKKVDLDAALSEHCPKGIDIYFENVGGKFLETVLKHLNPFARVPCCGMISQYNVPPADQYGVKNLTEIVGKRIRMEGFIVGDFAAQYQEDFDKHVLNWIKDGKIVYKEDVSVGIESAPETFVGMLQGKNFGKQVVKIADL